MMIGIDIERVARFALLSNDPLLQMLFTPREIEYARGFGRPEEHLCGFFCAKEAVLKTISGTKPLHNTIEIVHDSQGQPSVVFNGSVVEGTFLISISHCDTYSVAQALRLP